MTRARRWLLRIGVGLGVLILVLGAAAIMIVRTDWFRNHVKERIIAAAGQATGGRVEVGAFNFDWRHLTAEVTDFVIHGSEPPEVPPFLRIPRVVARIHLFTSIHLLLDVAYLGVDRPQANIFVMPDGHSNVPTPKAAKSGGPPLQSIVNAAVGHFDLNDATIAFADAPHMFSLHANNFQAQLVYNVLRQGYRGQISFQPLYVAAGRNTPVGFTVRLPVAVESDRVALEGATIATPQSTLSVSGSVENLRNPRITGHITGRIAFGDLKNAANLPLTPSGPGAPAVLSIDAQATASREAIDVAGLRLSAGHSRIEASGALKNARGAGSLRFNAQVALNEIGQFLSTAGHPDGTVTLSGNAKFDSLNNYEVNGNIASRGISIQSGSRRFGSFNVAGLFHLDPRLATFKNLRLDAAGANLEGDVSLQDFAHYRFQGTLRNLTLQAIAELAGEKQFSYAGTIAGPISAAGSLKTTRDLAVQVRLFIAPGSGGIPVSGRLSAHYDAETDDLQVENSYVSLPHSRLNASGSAGRQLNVSLVTSDLNDLLVATSERFKTVFSLGNQPALFTGTVTGGVASARIAGHLHAGRFSAEGRAFDSLALDAVASSQNISVENGLLTRGFMQARVSAAMGLDKWKVTASSPIQVRAEVRDADLTDILALAGEPLTGTRGALAASAQMNGTLGNPVGSVNLLATNGMVHGEAFDRIQAQANLSDRLLTIPSATADHGNSRVTLTAELRHPRDRFTSGQLHAHIQSTRLDLAQLETVQRRRPDTVGTLEINADVTSDIGGPSKFILTALSGDLAARGLRLDGENYGDLTLNARTNGQTVEYRGVSTFAGASIRVSGNTQLVRDYATSLDASVSNLPIERALAVARRADVPAKGRLSGTAHFSGTKNNPAASIDMDLANAVLYEEPVDRLHVTADYQPQRLDVQKMEIAVAGSRFDLTGRFDHPKNDFKTGSVSFHLDNSAVDLARLHNVQLRRPGLSGRLRIAADGSADLRAAEPRIALRELTANIAATGISIQGKNLGDATLTANTQNKQISVTLASNMAGANIQGRATAQPSRGYPVDAELNFSNVSWARLHGLVAHPNASESNFDAAADGEVTLQGSLTTPGDLRGSVRLTRLELDSMGQRPGAPQVALKNQGPIAAALDRGTLRIESAHLADAQSNLQATGSISFPNRSLDVTLNANANLAILQSFDRDIASSGNLILAATARGPVTKPVVNGSMQLRDGAFNYSQFPNGISKANGTVMFSGNSASVNGMTAESGGGKLSLNGFLLLSDTPRFGLRVNASGVRVRAQQGVSVVTEGNLDLTGTRTSSSLSGHATITRITYSPKTDLGSLLTRAAPPIQSGAAPSPLFDNMKLDVQVQTSDALTVQSSLAQSLEGDANLRVRGTVSHPAILGRVNMTEGTLTFFGSTYTVNSGTVSFFNPVRIEPVLDVNLETNTKGVDVTLRVTGPIDNLKLSYTSDPPLQFEEIVGLLASGKTPTSDPTLLANQPPQQQTYSEMGESALMGQALANPIASRLQRVFGVTQLKIDPTFTNGSELPQAELALQQQIASNITFTYVTAVDNANAETIRVEVTLNRRWSAAAMRDENGIFSINLLYKRQIR